MEEEPGDEVREIWRQVPALHKQRLLTAVAGAAGLAIGWEILRAEGALIGMLLAGSLGEIGGVVRWGARAGVAADEV